MTPYTPAESEALGLPAEQPMSLDEQLERWGRPRSYAEAAAAAERLPDPAARASALDDLAACLARSIAQ